MIRHDKCLYVVSTGEYIWLRQSKTFVSSSTQLKRPCKLVEQEGPNNNSSSRVLMYT
jgi:hypothetical protein